MVFEERARAERAMAAYGRPDSQPVEQEPEWPSAAARILHARLSAGVTHTEMARQLGMAVMAYYDLERYDDEAFTVVSVGQLVALGKIVNVEPRVLLLGPEASGATAAIPFSDISERLAERIAREGRTAGEFGDSIGWDIEPLLRDSDALWSFNIV